MSKPKYLYQQPARQISKNFSIRSFEKYFLNSKLNFNDLSKLIKGCNVDDINCRFNVWRLCLGVVSVNSTVQQKKQQIKQIREKYQSKKQQALKITVVNKSSPVKQVKKNPLMMMGGGSKTQTKKQTESDQFLKQQIQKDVERTYQEMKFFQNKDILKLLSLILFVWCRRNPQVSYKQGMNQLLASVVFCYFQQTEFKSDKPVLEDVSNQLWQDHLYFNSVNYAQQDIYCVFQKIINIQGDMYKTQADQGIKQKVNPNSKNNTPILQRIIQIKDHKLKHIDLDLFRIIKIQDVQTKSFMLRWIRCMHTREFSLENSFVIWDSIFLQYLQSPESKKKGQFQFIDAMCLAMFIYMRSIVFTKQTAGEILQVYQKYPVLKRGAYLDQLIMLAWNVCEELRLQSNNINNSTQKQGNQKQTNWFEDSIKSKDLKLMKKPTNQQQKALVQLKSKTTQNKKNQNNLNPSIKTTKLADQLKPVQKQKKNLNEKVQIKKQVSKQSSNEEIKITNPSQIKKIQKPIQEQKPQIILKNQIKQKKQQSSPSQMIKINSNEIIKIIQELKQTYDLTKDENIQQNLAKVIKKLQSKLKTKPIQIF